MATAQAAAAKLAREKATAAAAAEVAAAEAAIREQRLRQPGVFQAVSALQARVRARQARRAARHHALQRRVAGPSRDWDSQELFLAPQKYPLLYPYGEIVWAQITFLAGPESRGRSGETCHNVVQSPADGVHTAAYPQVCRVSSGRF